MNWRRGLVLAGINLAIVVPSVMWEIIYRTERIPEVSAGLAWLWWSGLLLRKPVHLRWQSTLGGFRRLSN